MISPEGFFAPRWTRHSVVLALSVTAALYVLLPCLERFSASPRKTAVVRAVHTVMLPPSPPRPLKSLRRDNPDRIPDPPRPQMSRMLQKPKPLEVAMDLGMVIGNVGGDFSIDFGVSAPVLAEQVQALIFEIEDLDEPPRPLSRLKPVYPPHARMRRIEGQVVLEFIVDVDGTARDIEVIFSDPGDFFTRAAIRAIESWRFSPGIKSGKPVSVRVRQKVTFELD